MTPKKLTSDLLLEATNTKNVARNKDASPEMLTALFGKDDSTNRQLAKHPRSSAELLEKLSHSSDKATRKAVCLNANVDKAVLLRLAPQFPGEFFRNPVFDWLLLEDPDLFFQLDQGVLKNILKLPDCPQSFLQWAANEGSEQQQLAVAMNSNAPDDLISILAAKSGSVSDAAKGRLQLQHTEKINFDQVFRDEVIKALDGLDGLNSNHLDELYERDIIDVELACYFKTRRLMSISEAKKIEKKLKIKLLKLTERNIKEFDFDLVSIFCRSKSRCLRLIGLADRNAQPEILAKHCKSTDWVERLAISRNPSTPTNVLAILSKDTHAIVSLQAKKTIQIKAESQASQNTILSTANNHINLKPIVEKICNEFREGECWPSVAAGTLWWSQIKLESKIGARDDDQFLINLPFSIEKMVNSPHDWVRSVACDSPLVLPEHLMRLAKDESWFVRFSVAQNTKTPSLALKSLAKDSNELVRDKVFGNSSFPLSSLKLKGFDIDFMADKLAAKSPRTSLLVFEKLYKDVSSEIRGDIASNPMAPIHILEVLAKDKNPVVRKKVAENINIPLHILEILVFDKNEYVRVKVAMNDKTPLELLHILSKDRKWTVRCAVAKNSKNTDELLRNLLQDNNYAVRLWALYNPNINFELLQKFKIDNYDLEISGDVFYCRYIRKMQDVLQRLKAEDPNTSENELLDLARVGLWSTRLAAIDNPFFPLAARDQERHKLLREMDDAVSAKYTPSTPNNVELHEIPAALKALRCSMLNQTDKNAVARAAKSEDLLERVGATLAPGIQPSLLRLLLDDEVESVRQLATYRLRELGQSGALSDEIRGFATLDAQCPTCKGLVKEDAEEYTCIGAEDEQGSQGCGFGFKKTHAGRSFIVGEAEQLVREGKIGPLTGFISKAGAPFTAKMCFLFNNSSQNYRLQFDFDKERKPVRSGALTDFSNQISLGQCPKCSSSVYEQEKDYVCINSVVLAANPKPHCDFKTSRIVLQQAISREQIGKLLSSGRTDPLEGFVSSRTKKRFTAMLVWDPVVGKVNFEFET